MARRKVKRGRPGGPSDRYLIPAYEPHIYRNAQQAASLYRSFAKQELKYARLTEAAAKKRAKEKGAKDLAVRSWLKEAQLNRDRAAVAIERARELSGVRVMTCVKHKDCRMHPEIGRACAQRDRGRRRSSRDVRSPTVTARVLPHPVFSQTEQVADVYYRGMLVGRVTSGGGLSYSNEWTDKVENERMPRNEQRRLMRHFVMAGLRALKDRDSLARLRRGGRAYPYRRR